MMRVNRGQVLHALEGFDTHRWNWDGIDACFTGKDADLGGGQVGVKVGEIIDNYIHCIAHFGITICGHDVCLNDPDGATDEQIEAAKEAYMGQAQELVWNCGIEGDWSGDDWYLSTEREFFVHLAVMSPDELASKIYDETWIALASVQREADYMGTELNVLCGWKNHNGHRCKPGKPGPGSVFRMGEW